MKLKIKPKITKTFFPTLILTAIFVFSFFKQSTAYDNKRTHPQLAELAVKLYNQNHPDKKITDEELKWIKQGAIEEDNPVLRCTNHFYDPTTGKPIIPTADTAIEWAHSSTEQSVAGMGGNYTWEQAKYDFVDNN
ncbi:MAG: hypothetical protein V1688_01960, partial [bacterium]